MDEIEKFKKGYETAKKKKTSEERVVAFKRAATRFADGAAHAAGASVVKVLKAQLGAI